MNYDPRAIANEFLRLAWAEGKAITPLKLQKLIYYAYGWCLAIKGEPLFDEGVQAWRFGPVIPSVYYEFREYGNASITSKSSALPIMEEASSSFVLQLVSKVWDAYKKFDAIQLSNATHVTGSPWETTIRNNGGTVWKNKCIDDEVIRDYFRSQAKS